MADVNHVGYSGARRERERLAREAEERWKQVGPPKASSEDKRIKNAESTEESKGKTRTFLKRGQGRLAVAKPSATKKYSTTPRFVRGSAGQTKLPNNRLSLDEKALSDARKGTTKLQQSVGSSRSLNVSWREPLEEHSGVHPDAHSDARSSQAEEDDDLETFKSIENEIDEEEFQDDVPYRRLEAGAPQEPVRVDHFDEYPNDDAESSFFYRDAKSTKHDQRITSRRFTSHEAEPMRDRLMDIMEANKRSSTRHNPYKERSEIVEVHDESDEGIRRHFQEDTLKGRPSVLQSLSARVQTHAGGHSTGDAEELSRLREENARLKKDLAVLRRARTEGTLTASSREDLDLERRRFEEYRTDMMKKIQRERRVLERQQGRAVVKAAERKDGEEAVEKLKTEIKKLQDKLRTQESSWKQVASRWRKRAEEEANRKDELLSELLALQEEHRYLQSRYTSLKNATSGWVSPPVRKSYRTPNAWERSWEPSDNEEDNNDNYEQDEVANMSAPSTDAVGRRKLVGIQLPDNHSDETEEESHDLSAPMTSTNGAEGGLYFPLDPILPEGVTVSKRLESGDGRVDVYYSDGSRFTRMPDMTTKVKRIDGSSLVTFPNGDTKECFAGGRSIYHYAAQRINVESFADGTVVYHYPEGRKEVVRS